jgi:hypothetical protein
MSTPDGGFRAAPQLDLTAAMGAERNEQVWPRAVSPLHNTE